MLISREQFMALTARINERYLPWLNVVQGDLTLSRLRVCLSFRCRLAFVLCCLTVRLTASWWSSWAEPLAGIGNVGTALLLRRQGAYWLSLRYTSVLLGLPTTPVFMDGNHGAVRWTRIDAVCTHPYDIRRRQCLVDGLCHVTGCFIAGGCGYAYDTDRWPCFSYRFGLRKYPPSGRDNALSDVVGRHGDWCSGFSLLLEPFSYFRLIQVIQGSALVVAGLNIVAMWQMEPRRPDLRALSYRDPVLGSRGGRYPKTPVRTDY